MGVSSIAYCSASNFAKHVRRQIETRGQTAEKTCDTKENTVVTRWIRFADNRNESGSSDDGGQKGTTGERECIHRERGEGSYGGSYHRVITLIAAIKSHWQPRGATTAPRRLFSLPHTHVHTRLYLATSRRSENDNGTYAARPRCASAHRWPSSA